VTDSAAPTSATATPSLHRRVSLIVLAVLAVLLLVLGVTIDALVGVQARRDRHDRLMASASRADALARVHTPPDQLVAQLGGGGIRALLVTADGSTYGDHAIRPDTTTGPIVPPPPPPPPPPRPWGPPPPPPPPDATATVIVHPLRTGGRVILVADTTQTTALIRRLREVMIIAGLITLAIAGALFSAVTRAALRPLDRLTTLARTITGGDRGERLRPDRPDTELGRAAAAFDGMLDTLEASERRAQHSAAIAQHAEATTRQFIADAAHELRTPLTGIRAAAEQLHNSAIQHNDESQYRRAALLLTESRRASRLISDMLDLTRIDAGVALEPADANLTAIADAECERARMLSPGLQITRTGEAAVLVHADPTRLAQILSNLIDNARRHTPAGGSIVTDVRFHPRAGRVELTVTDSGPGIPDAQRERIFERLVRLDAARNADRGGAGLGLSIARGLARAHGGDLVCLAHVGGARFQLTLPVGSRTRRDAASD
jgi:two-component system OmpR family sensor kinase